MNEEQLKQWLKDHLRITVKTDWGKFNSNHNYLVVQVHLVTGENEWADDDNVIAEDCTQID